jgi:hypothetical protein
MGEIFYFCFAKRWESSRVGLDSSSVSGTCKFNYKTFA